MRKIKEIRKGRNAGRYRNGADTLEQAKDLNARFHGRDTREIIDLIEDYRYEKNGAVLGQLIELMLITDESKGIGQPIRFGKSRDDNSPDNSRPFLVSNPKGNQLYILGGDQRFDVSELGIKKDKQYTLLGSCFSISYWTDKHHLEGPKKQAKGLAYEHEFGENGGEQPAIVYDSLNQNFMLIGGSYTIEPEGITN